MSYIIILENYGLPTLWQQFVEDPKLFHHDSAPVHKVKSRYKWFTEFYVDLWKNGNWPK